MAQDWYRAKIAGIGALCAALLTCTLGVGCTKKTPSDNDQQDKSAANKDKGDKGDKPPGDKGNEVKPKNPLAATGPVGKVPDAELGPRVDVWDFTLRPPRNMAPFFQNVKLSGPDESHSYVWKSGQKLESQYLHLVKQRTGADKDPLDSISRNRRFVSKPTDFTKINAIVKPEAVEINGLAGARLWEMHQDKLGTGILIEYRFHVDGWAYLFMCPVIGRTEQELRRNAEAIDASICTFRKR